jgi:seryl-tRNA synthetase
MGNFAKDKIADLESEIKAITADNVSLGDRLKAATEARDNALSELAELKHSSWAKTEELTAKINELQAQLTEAPVKLDAKVKDLVTEALISAGHQPVQSSGNSEESKKREEAKAPQNSYQAAANIVAKLGLARK